MMATGVAVTKAPWILDHSLLNSLEIHSSFVPLTSALPALSHLMPVLTSFLLELPEVLLVS